MASPVVGVQVVGTSLQVRLADDRVLSGQALVGAVLTIADSEGQRQRVRIESAERDDADAPRERWLYRLTVVGPTQEVRAEFCQPGPDGRRLGFPVQGTASADGRYQPSATRFIFTCTGGAIGKCIRLGYEPWRSAAGGESLLDYFRACLRMVRADYCGSGETNTRNGMMIDVYDRLGIQRPEAAKGFSFEAAWGPDGAVCLRKTRVPELRSLSEMVAACSARLRGQSGLSCDEEAMRADPQALLFNTSRSAP